MEKITFNKFYYYRNNIVKNNAKSKKSNKVKNRANNRAKYQSSKKAKSKVYNKAKNGASKYQKIINFYNYLLKLLM